MKTKHEIVTAMCYKWNHAYGITLTPEMKRLCPLMSGYTEEEAQQAYKEMEEIYEVATEEYRNKLQEGGNIMADNLLRCHVEGLCEECRDKAIKWINETHEEKNERKD